MSNQEDKPETLSCNHCRIPQPRDGFYTHPYSPSKARQPCKECLRAQRRHRYATQGGIHDSYAQVLRDKYGLTLDDYYRMVREQGNRCAVCRKPETAKGPNGKPRRLAVDHDHANNTVRALLCIRCNKVVWALEDNHTVLPAIEAYIRHHREAIARLDS